MTLFDDNTAPALDSATSTLTEHSAETSVAPQPQLVPPPEEKPASTDDFASALEIFTTETVGPPGRSPHGSENEAARGG